MVFVRYTAIQAFAEQQEQVASRVDGKISPNKARSYVVSSNVNPLLAPWQHR